MYLATEHIVFRVLSGFYSIERKERFKLMHGYNNRTIVIHELVGLDAEVVDSKDRSQIGIHGEVIRETKNLLYVKTGDATVKVVKLISEFRFRVGNRRFDVKGEEINFRSHERTEKALKFYKLRKEK